MRHILALDQGTTSSRAIVFSETGAVVSSAHREFEQIYPQPGHVEHNPETIWESQLATAQLALESAQLNLDDLQAIGITNQRETVVLWERETGKPVANAIVWQSRITTPICKQLKADGYVDLVREKTGLVIDPYFSATKVQYLLDSINGLRTRAERGEICFGTVDSFLIYRLTGGKVHATDVSNASRTMLFNIHTLDWDEELLKLFKVPRAMLPQVKCSSEVYGETDISLFGKRIPIAGVAGDQQAATFGQCCFDEGDAKNTYGTGCFMPMNTGSKPVMSRNGLLTTIGWKIGNEVTYCLEGSVFVAGAAVQWLRDGLKIIETSAAVELLANSVSNTDGVYFVPAFVGLGTPHWDPHARGIITGITRGTTHAHIARAAVEAMAYQSMDVLITMERDSGISLSQLKVDGGASINNSLLQFQADLLNVPVKRPTILETTALGAAYLAGLAVGIWRDRSEIQQHWSLDKEFNSAIDEAQRQSLAQGWQDAVRRSLSP